MLDLQVEYERLARRLGYKNAHSAKAAWNALRKKLDKVAEGAPVGTFPSIRTLTTVDKADQDPVQSLR